MTSARQIVLGTPCPVGLSRHTSPPGPPGHVSVENGHEQEVHFVAGIIAESEVKRSRGGGRKLQAHRRHRIVKLYRQQSGRVMFPFLLLLAVKGDFQCERTLWAKPRSSEWWEGIVLQTITNCDQWEDF